jgi:hypothetical protein
MFYFVKNEHFCCFLSSKNEHFPIFSFVQNRTLSLFLVSPSPSFVPSKMEEGEATDEKLTGWQNTDGASTHTLFSSLGAANFVATTFYRSDIFPCELIFAIRIV